ncbi:MFS transporter [Siccirubricoccus deserti]|uniref:MFS transporter n=1 Tax=Siccirubricoccus deserti TaxID=2013562 RepID=A0A9X0QYY9_9PROT|nr:MFS transporter [Siccirubricoccus deserti]MBC4016444.1 MFS transporter [Siccirubricoccus deserti]GGC48982.1 MFS transporter [Siccirubricoccus deserti]
MATTARPWPQRLPFYYGWVIVAVAFVTMAIGVTARTAFSLLLPPLIDEFGWERGLVAGAFSFGFLVSAVLGPVMGRMMDRHDARAVIGTGVAVMTAGLLLAPAVTEPWHLYATLGVLVGGGANLMGYNVQSLYLTNWFLRRRGLAISLAFSGVGIGAILLLPWLQAIILDNGWRAACWTMGLLVLCVLIPLTLLVRRRPQDIGLQPDGGGSGTDGAGGMPRSANIVDPAWASVQWTLARAMGTGRFWWIALGFFCALFAWYAVQVHQTRYLVEVGFSPEVAAWALGIVSVVAIPGQIGLGALSDRVGREWVWMVGCCGFALCYVALIALEQAPSPALLWLMVIAQGSLGYALTSVMGPIVVEIFEGPHYGAIFGAITVALIGGGAAGPWTAGVIHDATGSYRPAFVLAGACCVVSAAAIWIAAPRKVRLVPGRAGRK